MRCIVILLAGLGMLSGLFAFGQGNAAEDTRIGPISHLAVAGGDDMTIRLNGRERIVVQTFMIKGEKPRLVLDFFDCTPTGRMNTTISGGNLVRAVRVGLHHQPREKVRVVFDLATDREIVWTKTFPAGQDVMLISLRPAGYGSSSAPATATTPETTRPTADVPRTAVVDSGGEPVQLGRDHTKVKVAPLPVLQRGKGAGEKKVVAAKAEPGASTPEDNAAPASTAPAPAAAVPDDDQLPPAESTGAAVPAALTTPSVLTEVSFDDAFSRSGEMILMQLSRFQPPAITTRELDPPQVFCDFGATTVGSKVPAKLEVGGKYVRRIRIGDESGKARVILDLAPGGSYDLQQVFFKEDNLFVLIVNHLEKD
ncbi:MAG: hypothetical protein ACK5PS_09780 [Desulfopila sp.]